MSYLLKGLERIVDWHIRTPDLIAKLQSGGQHAYMAKTSTESALHNIIARAEKTWPIWCLFGP